MRRILPLLAAGVMALSLSAQYPGQPPAGPGYPNPGYPPPQGYPPQGYPSQGYPNQNQNGGPPPAQPEDVPGQPVARIGVLNGDASIQHRDSGEWTAAVVNAPVVAGDAISLPPGSRAELQLDFGNFLRIDGDTELRFAAFDGSHAQIQISRGSVTWRSLRDSPLRVELSTQVVAVHPDRLSAVRVEAAADGSTRVTVRRGQSEASTPRGTEMVHEGGTMLVHGAPDGGAEYQIVAAAPPDAWDAWNDQRDNFLSRAQSNRYLSPDIDGGEDLDAAGRWGYDPNYGNVWTPTNVPPGWAPYSDGSWVSMDPYGWTWVDAAPWGWAPFHYGSWYMRAGFGWTWWPGPRLGRVWWHPAMVGFFGFGSNIGWVPLAPYERFHPWYGPGVSVGVGFGFGRPGVAVAGSFRNAGFATGLAVADFQRGAFGNRFVVNRQQLAQSSLVRGPLPVAATAASRRFTSRAAVSAGPRASFSNQRFFSAGNSGMGRSAAPPASGWERFGQTPPGRSGGPVPQAGAGSGGWDRFGSPARPNAFQGGQQPRSLQVAPSIMRPREAAPSYGGGRSGYSRPSGGGASRGGGGGRPSGSGGHR